MNEAVIVSAVRTAVGKAPNGTLRGTRPDELAAAVIGEAIRRAPGLEAAEIDDVILGCAMPEGEQGLNVARIASLRAGMPVTASAVTVNRFCSSGLQAIAYAAERIMCGSASAIIAGGTESMSMMPMGGHKVAPNPSLVDRYPDVYLSTGLVAENHARESGISREAQDDFALRSHQRALAAIDAGRFTDEIVPVHARGRRPPTDVGRRDDVSRSTRDRGATPRRRRSRSFDPRFSVGHRHGRQLVADERWRGCGCRHVSATLARERGLAPLGTLRRVRDGRRRTGALRHRPGARHSQGAEAGGPDAGSDRSDRAERSVCGAGAGVPARTADRSRPPERERRRDRARPSAGLHRRETDDNAAPRTAAPQGRYGLVTMCVGGGMGAAGIFERM